MFSKDNAPAWRGAIGCEQWIGGASLLRGILAGTVVMLLALLYVPLLRDFFQLASPTIGLLALATGVGLASVLWYEGVKAWKRKRKA